MSFVKFDTLKNCKNKFTFFVFNFRLKEVVSFVPNYFVHQEERITNICEDLTKPVRLGMASALARAVFESY